ncbi:MAG: zinc dependent phospholipase C family protein [Nitrospirae bacterium]|nr:zinc dependent phospholipase C family protein [Nitrospirota bacterium]
MIVVLCILGISLLFPPECLAWGPSTHLWIGQHVLSSLPQIASETASLISAYRSDYLYGCIGADILFGKNLAEYRYHCHNWSVARELLDRSQNDHHRAFTYGYFTHLAADIVSHNIFVPFQLINFFYKRAFKHTYWEFCVERHVLQELHVSFRQIFREAARRNNDLLQAQLTPTLLNFQTNRLLFSGVMFLDQFRNRRLKQNVYLSHAEIDAFLKLALGNARQFLRDGESAPQWKADPAGLQNIAEARQLRDFLRRTHRGKPGRKRAWKRGGIHVSAHGLPPSPPYPLRTLLEGRFSLPVEG